MQALLVLARLVGVDVSTVRRWENGESNPRTYQRRPLADALEVPLDEIDWYLARDDELPAGPYPEPPVDRREFLTTTAAFAIAGSLVTDQPRVVGDDHVELVEATIRRLEQQDAAVGGGTLYKEAARLRWQIEQWLDRRSFSPRVGQALQAQVGELSAWAGWLAFDDDRPAEAGYYLKDALTQARLTDDPALEVRALNCLCLVARREDRPRLSLECADAGLRLAKGWATPRLAALLHLRAAQGHASLGEASTFSRELAKAAGQLDRGVHPDDPLYIEFVTPQELTGLAGVSHLALGRPDRAAQAFRDVVEDPDPARPRNVTFYTVRLAQALAQQGDITQASEVAIDVMPQVVTLASRRTVRRLTELRSAIEPHRTTVPAARDFVEAHDTTFAA